MRMNILSDILEKEGDNRGFVYLYCLEDSWKAFGYSAFYLSLLYPGMKIRILYVFVCVYRMIV